MTSQEHAYRRGCHQALSHVYDELRKAHEQRHLSASELVNLLGRYVDVIEEWREGRHPSEPAPPWHLAKDDGR